MACSTVVNVGASMAGSWGRQMEIAAVQPAEGWLGNSAATSHGLTEDELRALIAEDLRGFMRRPMAGDGDGSHLRPRPFLLDRLVRVAT